MINKRFLVFSFVWWKVYAYKHKMIWNIISFKFSTSKNVTLKMLFSGPFYFYISYIFFVIILGWEKKMAFISPSITFDTIQTAVSASDIIKMIKSHQRWGYILILKCPLSKFMLICDYVEKQLCVLLI